MAFEDYEYSVDDSQPDELYDFEYEGTGDHYRITSSSFPITFQTNVYNPVASSRTGIKRTSDFGKNEVTVKVDRNDAYFARYLAGSLTYRTKFTLYTLQPDGSFIQAWTGFVKTVSKTEKDMTVSCNPISTNASRPVIHKKDQIQCPHILGDYNCGVNLTSFTKAGVVDSFSGTTIVSSTFATEADGWFKSGTITIGAEIKTIVGHVGNSITLLDAFYGITAGDSFSAHAGCDHTIGVCDSKFSNYLNYGGNPFMPMQDDITSGRSFVY